MAGHSATYIPSSSRVIVIVKIMSLSRYHSLSDNTSKKATTPYLLREYIGVHTKCWMTQAVSNPSAMVFMNVSVAYVTRISERGRRLSLPAPIASPQTLSSAFLLAQEAGKRAHGHPLPHPACP